MLPVLSSFISAVNSNELDIFQYSFAAFQYFRFETLRLQFEQFDLLQSKLTSQVVQPDNLNVQDFGIGRRFNQA